MKSLFEGAALVVAMMVLGAGLAYMAMSWAGGPERPNGGIGYLSSSRIEAWLDPETGCEYVIHNSAFIPRLMQDGRQVCNGGADRGK